MLSLPVLFKFLFHELVFQLCMLVPKSLKLLTYCSVAFFYLVLQVGGVNFLKITKVIALLMLSFNPSALFFVLVVPNIC